MSVGKGLFSTWDFGREMDAAFAAFRVPYSISTDKRSGARAFRKDLDSLAAFAGEEFGNPGRKLPDILHAVKCCVILN